MTPVIYFSGLMTSYASFGVSVGMHASHRFTLTSTQSFMVHHIFGLYMQLSSNTNFIIIFYSCIVVWSLAYDHPVTKNHSIINIGTLRSY
jgi:predicted HAD superfamily hydrolase